MRFPQADRMNERRLQGDKAPDVPSRGISTSTLITWRRNSRQLGLAPGLRLPATRHGKWPAHIPPHRNGKGRPLALRPTQDTRYRGEEKGRGHNSGKK